MIEKPVLIVGAGPTGLTLALLLQKEGVPFHIVDSREGPHDHSRALGIHARTLEIFDQIGIADEAVSRGFPVHGARIYVGKKRLTQLSTSFLPTAHPYILVLPQEETEKLLLETLEKRGGKVFWNTSFSGYTEKKERIIAHFEKGETGEFSYLVGCDGINSKVREQSGITFAGKVDQDQFILADITLEGPISHKETSMFYVKEGIALFIPMKEGIFRIIFNRVPFKEKYDQSTFQKILDRRIPFHVKITSMHWSSHFEPKYYMVSQFQKGRLFLAGDAAHVHSPAGGQGMNTGIQDVYNLSWKLSAAVRGKASASLLESYHVERSEIAKNTLHLTRNITRMTSIKSSFWQFMRNSFLSLFAKRLDWEEKAVHRISQLSLEYRHSPLAMKSFRGKGPRPGERAPDSYLSDGSRLYDHLRSSTYVALFFAGDDLSDAMQHKIDRMSGYIHTELRSQVEIILITKDASLEYFSTSNEMLLLDSEGKIHEKYGAHKTCLYLIRPDKHIALRDALLETERIKDYFLGFFFASA